MLGEMSGATATCVAAPSTTCKAEDSLRDVAAEREALSLAHRRGKCAPSVDTKLTDAWLGFYVALTNTPFAGSAATTEAATETSLSEWASSHGGSSPRRAADGETEESPVFNEAGPCDEATEEETPTKRPSKSHRRRRTRGKGKKNAAAARAAEAALQDEGKACHTLEEEGTRLDAAVGVAPSTPSVAACGHNRLGAIMSTSPSSGAPSQVTAPWPFQGPRMNEHCGRAVLPIDTRSPSKPCAGPMGIVSTMPNAGQTPKHREASDRTPPRIRPGFGSPLAQIMPGTPTSFGFGTPTNQAICSTGGHMAYQGGHLLVASPVHDQAGNAFFMTSPDYSVPPPTPANTPMAAGYPQDQGARNSVDAWRSWLAGSPMSGVDLIKQLEAAAPETYED